MPATWLIVSIWRGRKRRRNKLMSDVSNHHHNAAPQKKPAMIIKLVTSDEAVCSVPPVPMPNIAKKARM